MGGTYILRSDGVTVDRQLEEAEQADVTALAKRVKLVDEMGVDIDASNPLDVSLSSDVEIGAVEIKDATSDTRLKVKSDGTDNAAVVTANVLALPTGAATSAKQLPNDHDVNVTNMIPAVETGLATSAKQLPDDHNVTANAGTNLNTSALATEATLAEINATTVTSNEGINTRTSNVNQEQLLGDILKEMKIMNLHLSLMTDTTIKKTEVE